MSGLTILVAFRNSGSHTTEIVLKFLQLVKLECCQCLVLYCRKPLRSVTVCRAAVSASAFTMCLHTTISMCILRTSTMTLQAQRLAKLICSAMLSTICD